eukprot:maker-scaffold_67-snap-gene-0.10-mRNA-1 protein AED:0.04 eAED:0.04 QI:0/0/0.5/1/0/1/2/145/228
MPKSKRAKVISLTSTTSKGREGKSNQIDIIQKYCDEFSHIYLFTTYDSRTTHLKQLRTLISPSRIYMGKKSLIKLAFGKTKELEYLDNLNKLTQIIDNFQGQIGVIFSNEKEEIVENIIKKVSQPEFARSNSLANINLKIIPNGKLPKKDEVCFSGFPTSLVEHLKKLGVPVRIKNSEIFLDKEFIISEKGKRLNPAQAELLKMFNKKTANFEVSLLALYSEGKVNKN